MTLSRAKFGTILTDAMAQDAVQALGRGSDWALDMATDWTLQGKSAELIKDA